VDYRVEPPGGEFRRAVEKLRTGPKHVRSAMNKAIKEATAPAERELKAAVLAIDSQGVKGGGSTQRIRHLQGRSAAGIARLPKHTGLRKNIARGVTRKITYRGFSTGVRIRAAGTYLPDDQRVLIGKTNSGKNFRHPVMGDTERWVDQSFSPPGWFDKTMKKYGPEAIRKIDAAARDALRKLQ
jgi:hypothetical protein